MLIRTSWPAMLWSFVILVLTLLPGGEIPDVKIIQFDKLVHAFIFAVLMFLSSYGLKRYAFNRRLFIHPLLITSVYCIVFGVMIEVLQQLVPERLFSYGDMLANNAGVLFGYLAFVVSVRRGFIDPNRPYEPSGK